MAQYNINYMHNKKKDLWVLFERTLCQLTEQLWLKTVNPLAFFCLSLFY